MKKIVGLGLLAIIPCSAAATVTSANLMNIQKSIANITGTVNLIISLFLGIALLSFIWGVIRYIGSGSSPEKLRESKNFIVFSVIALAVMLSIWALALLAKGFFFPHG